MVSAKVKGDCATAGATSPLSTALVQTPPRVAMTLAAVCGAGSAAATWIRRGRDDGNGTMLAVTTGFGFTLELALASTGFAVSGGSDLAPPPNRLARKLRGLPAGASSSSASATPALRACAKIRFDGALPRFSTSASAKA